MTATPGGGPPPVRGLQRWTPVFLLVLGLLVLFERFLPGRKAFVEQTSEDAVLRLAIALLCFFLAVSFAERALMRQHMLELLQTMRNLARQLKREGGGISPQEQREASLILVNSLQSSDPNVRTSAAGHLKRITGQDFGSDAARWRDWIDRNLPG